ncbi:GPI inositol deacylase [Malassezia caprae]|uniref:GPI inositol-deacylase n=1 Tax=Malassezia caprae TaxID=1381934 RepID=A0AAF0E3U8_9BASI|nr:GPI inositol deacylase [Malassezia caprae]
MQVGRFGGYHAVLLMLCSLVVLLYVASQFFVLPRTLHMRMACRMARMIPSYVVHDEELRAYSASRSPVMHKYSLREYRERGAKQPLYFGPQKLEPMPVLFIPGNAGSYAQVRSLAASSWDQYWQGRMDMPAVEFFNVSGPLIWYTIDFNEDFSAFHGQTLHDQAFYVNEVLRYLQYLHPSADNGVLQEGEQSATVALVGHSMGGIVARLALELDNYLPGTVDTIVTLSTPHAFPPVPFDRSIDQVYRRINRAHSDPMPLLISLAGGVLDTQLSSDASSLSLARLGPPESRLSSFTTSVAALWSSTDHLAIVWCDQLRFKIARALLRDYEHFGRLFDGRSLSDVRDARHELWRTILGLPNDAASAAERRRAALAAAHEPGASISKNTQLMPIDLTNKGSALLRQLDVEDVKVHVYKALAPPGPRQTYTGNVTDEDEALGFEVVTNLSVGPNAERDPPYAQTHEMFVALCTRRLSLEPMSEYPEPAYCYPIFSHAYEQLPWSPTEPDGLFPQARVPYAAPAYHLNRLFLSHEFLRAHHVESVRVEYTRKPAAQPAQQGVPSIVRLGWTESKPLILRGKPSWLRPQTWELPGVPPASLLSSFDDHAALWHWHAPELDSALTAYRFTLEPAPCALKRHAPPPQMNPMLRILSASTSDSRIFPSLNVSAPNDMVVAMHGAAPFMPPPIDRGLRFQLWHLDTYRSSAFSGVYSSQCPLPYARLRVSVHWRASLALLVLRYRLALVVWPLGVLALARVVSGPSLSPFAALVRLMNSAWGAMLIAAPVALHLLVYMGASLGAPPYTLGIGLPSLAFVWLGPALAILAYGLAVFLSVLAWMGLHGFYALGHMRLGRLGPWWSPVAELPPVVDAWPSRAALVAWTRKRSTCVGAVLLAACIVFLPHQVLVLVCTLVQAGTALRSYAALRQLPREADAARRALWEQRHSEHLWLLQCLLWLLPLHAPVLVVWVRNVNAGFSMGFSRAEHNVIATAALLALVYIHAAPWTLRALDSGGARLGTNIVYGTLSLGTLVYGIRYSYVLYEVFVAVLVWELAQRLWPLTHAREASAEHLLLTPVQHLAVPPSLATPEPPAIEHLLAKYLETLEAYMQARTRVSDAMQAGFLQLTRAKMALGGTYGQRISSDAYDARMSAQLRLRTASDVPETERAPALRRRAGAAQETATPTSTHGASGFDPLYQFSGLPPPALKAAQRHFREAATHLFNTEGPVATGSDVWMLQRRLEALEQHIDTCRRT